MTRHLQAVSASTPAAEPLRAVIYARTSRDRHLRARSTSSQVDHCLRDADANGWDVVETIVDDDRSASERARKARPGWDRVVQLLDSGSADVLLMFEGSRATRALDVYVDLEQTLRRRSVLLAYGGDVYDLSRASDRRRARQDAVDAGYEADRTSERILRSKTTDAERGWVGGPTPYGYRRVYDERTGILLRQEPDPHQAAVVRFMVDAVLIEGRSSHSVAMELNERGEPTPKPPRSSRSVGWSSKTVQQVLRGPAIAGLRRHARPGQEARLYEGSWPGIISTAERDALLAATYVPARRTHESNAPRHLLSWIALCECGRPARHKVKRQKGVAYEAYACSDPRCSRLYIAQPPVDEFVAEAVIGFLAVPANRAAVAGVRPSTGRLDAIEAQQREMELEQRKDELMAAFTRGEVSAATLGEASKVLDRELAEIAAARQPARPTDPAILRLAGADDVERAWGGLGLLDRRAVVRELFEIVLHPARFKGARRFDPDRIEIRRR
ncbi:recombinase family protein [Isoptericola croceus]|uniref:recombinase family protein n=1 Tax=Isoptericola croceus TaxID=3031406 RepID=UPI0023F9FE0F|nr:recombinase family protein [Isoptericola croceus]